MTLIYKTWIPTPNNFWPPQLQLILTIADEYERTGISNYTLGGASQEGVLLHQVTGMTLITVFKGIWGSI